MWFASKNHTTKKYLSFILASPPPLISLPLLSLSLSSRNTLLAPSSMTMTTATLDPPPPPLLIAGSLLDDDRDAGSAASSSPRWLPWARGSTVGSPPFREEEEAAREKGNAPLRASDMAAMRGRAATTRLPAAMWGGSGWRRRHGGSSPDGDDDCHDDGADACRGSGGRRRRAVIGRRGWPVVALHLFFIC